MYTRGRCNSPEISEFLPSLGLMMGLHDEGKYSLVQANIPWCTLHLHLMEAMNIMTSVSSVRSIRGAKLILSLCNGGQGPMGGRKTTMKRYWL